MEYNFTNGNAEQKALWREAVTHLLNLPADDIPLVVTVTFAPPEDLIGKGHTDLALTTFTYDSAEAETLVRNDAPGFGSQRESLEALAASMGLEYSATKHFHETSAHELAHALYASLTQETRVAIARMFGAKSDNTSELFPAAKAWEDRIGEAIAETFKEAFLPRRYRVFPNRTNIHIPYSKFPEFRSLFRELFEPGESEEVGDEPGQWFRNKRQDALRIGAQVSPRNLPEAPKEKGVTDSGLYALQSDVMNPLGDDPFPPRREYRAYAAADWIALPTDKVEARQPIVVPAVNDPDFPLFREFSDPEHRKVGNAEVVLRGEWTKKEEEDPFVIILGGDPGQSILYIVELLVEDKEFHQFRLRWSITATYQTYSLVRVEPKHPEETLDRIQGWRTFTTLTMHKIDGEGTHLVFEEDLGLEPGDVVDFSTSGLEIFQMAEAHGQTPKYRETQAGYFMELREGGIEYLLLERESTQQDLNQIWDRMPQCWVSPLTFKPEEGEGRPIHVGLPSGLLVPGGAAGAAMHHRRPVAGTRA